MFNEVLLIKFLLNQLLVETAQTSQDISLTDAI